MKVLYVYADSKKEWNCSEWNCIIPAKHINKTKKHTAKTLYINEFLSNSEESQALCKEADVIVVERNFFGDTLVMMQYWKVRNKTVLAIFDDAYNIMHPKNISYGFWTKGEIKGRDKDGNIVSALMRPLPIEQFGWGLRIAKGVQVPSVNLAKDWAKFNKTYYVHNFLDMDKYMNVEPLYEHEELLVGWCGSLSHHSSFTDSGVIPALENISKKYPNVKILISGDKRVYDLLKVKNKVFQKFVPPEQWTSLLKTLDIGLAPLSGENDKRRSWIKALEYMAVKVPWIATNYPTYDELHDFGTMTENGYKNWENAISEVIENHPKYQKLADTDAYDFALTQSSDKNIEKVILKLYEELLDTPYS